MIKTDFLVIGSGIAGLSFAIKASKYGNVTIITKKELMQSNTNYAQGGIAAVLDTNDSFQEHINDTIKTGCGLCNKEAVEILVKNGPQAINWLSSLGVEFDKEDEKLALAIEGGHSKRRIAHKGDYTGREIEDVLISSIRNTNVDIHENCLAYELIIDKGVCCGIKVLELKEKNPLIFYSKITVLATGGIGQLFAHSTNPNIATGDGIAIAYNAGSEIEDMEFVQFHPTTLERGKNVPNFLISEAVRGEGAILKNQDGDAFMQKYNSLGDLAPRDIVSRAVFEELKKGKVFLDVRSNVDTIKERFPVIYEECLNNGFDITKDLIPITPAAHYICGGIKVNFSGESNIPRLFAFGECACTGVNGANRLASNSLLESVVFSLLAIPRILKYLKRPIIFPEYEKIKFKNNNNLTYSLIKNELRKIMWDYAGIYRSVEGLSYAASRLKVLGKNIEKLSKNTLNNYLIELKNMVTVAKLIIKAASLRKESRGTHYLIEYPETDDKNWLKHIILYNNSSKII